MEEFSSEFKDNLGKGTGNSDIGAFDMERMFEAIDEDKSGTLSNKEFMDAVSTYCPNHSPAEIKELVEIFEATGEARRKAAKTDSFGKSFRKSFKRDNGNEKQTKC